MVSRDTILKLEESKSVIDRWLDKYRSGECQELYLDFSRADVLERWEAIMRDPEFPDRQIQLRHLTRILNLTDMGKVILSGT
jgi:hypothetical protein